MRLDRIIQALLPHDEKFFTFFDESARIMVEAALLMKQLPPNDVQVRTSIVNQIEELEHQGDTVTHNIFAELNSTFVTPFDREDIQTLASSMDDVTDYINGSANRFILYKIKECPVEMAELIDCLFKSVVELQHGISLLGDLRRVDDLRKIIQKVNEYENFADAIFGQAIANLFENEKDPIYLIKLKEMFVALETATDKCEDVANIFETILIKHA
jgi:predicted phosphate transport protein (TIGR00153 family)